MSKLKSLSQQPKSFWTALGFVSVLLMGVVDYVMGSEISLSIFYLLPIFVVTWFAGRKVGVLIAVASAATRFAVNLLWAVPNSHPAIPYWNAIVVLGIFLVVVLLEQKVKENTVPLMQEITERKRAEEALRASEGYFRALIENALDLITILDAEGVIRYQTPSVERVLGYKPAEWIGVNIVELLHPDDAPMVNAAMKEAASTGPLEIWQVRTRHKDGSWRMMEGIAKVLDTPFVTGIVVNSRDITERKQVEQELRESESRLRAIFGAVQTGIVIIDPEVHQIVDLNPVAAKLIGAPKEQIVGSVCHSYICSAEEGHCPITDLGQTVDISERILLTAGGVKCPVIKTVVTVIIGGKKHLLESFIDITERKQAEIALVEERNLMVALMDNMPDSIYFKDDQSRFIRVNQAIVKRLGVNDPAQMIGKTDFDFFGEEHARAAYVDEQTIIRTGQPLVDKEEKETFRDGHVLWASTTKMPRRDQHGQIVGTFGISRDITERKQYERELQAVAIVSVALRTAQTRAEMLPIILDQVLNLLQAEGAMLGIRDPATGEMVIELGRGALSEATSARLPPGAGIVGHVIATGEPFVSADVAIESRLYPKDLLADSRALACVPLIVQQQPYGILAVDRQAPIDGNEVRIITAIADIVANAIYRASLHEQTERRARQMAALHMIDTTISASLDLRLTLDVLLDNVITQLGVDAVDVLLLNPVSHVLEYTNARGFRTRNIEHTYLRLGEGHAGLAALERRVVTVVDLATNATVYARASLLVEEGFASQHVAPLIIKGQVKGVLEIFHRTRLDPDVGWLEFFEMITTEAAIAIDNASLFDNLQRSNVELSLAYDATIEGWSGALDLRDKETEGHSQRVTEITLRLAKAMGVGNDELIQVRRGALMHDIGKMGVPDSILLKPGKLTDEEWVLMKQHPRSAYNILLPITYLRPALDIPYCHHEKWDGTGYPRGLKGQEIPLSARIFAVVDVWDALTSDRPYRKAWSEEKARQYIEDEAGTHFDPQVVKVFLNPAAEFLHNIVETDP